MPKKQKKPDQSGKGLYDYIARNVFKSKMRKNEMHPPMWSKSGFKTPSFLGPGTSVVDKLREGLKPINEQDKIARMHDIRYTLSNNPDDVRFADDKMIKKLNDSKNKKSTYAINHYIGYLPIKLKMAAEDLGIIKKGSFSSMDSHKLSASDRTILEKERDIMAQSGYGKKKKPPSKWILHVKAYSKKHNISYSRSMKESKSTYKK
jgi:hypothetical protein